MCVIVMFSLEEKLNLFIENFADYIDLLEFECNEKTLRVKYNEIKYEDVNSDIDFDKDFYDRIQKEFRNNLIVHAVEGLKLNIVQYALIECGPDTLFSHMN